MSLQASHKQRVNIVSVREFLKDENIKEYDAITALDLGACRNLHSLDGILDLPNIQTLRVSTCKSLETIGLNIGGSTNSCTKLVKLVEIDVSHCTKLVSIDGLRDIQSLQVLNLSACRLLSNIDALSACAQLKELDISYSGVKSISALNGLQKLASLNLCSCEKWTSLHEITNCEFLEYVNITHCRNLSGNFQSCFEKLTNLKCLHADKMPEWSKHDLKVALKSALSLRELSLSSLSKQAVPLKHGIFLPPQLVSLRFTEMGTWFDDLKVRSVQ